MSESASEVSTTTDDTTMSVDPTETTTGDMTEPGTSTGEMPCPAGEVECDGEIAKVCDGLGGYSEETVCTGVCAPGLGCLECTPGDRQCEGNAAMVCNEAGTGWELHETCDDLLALVCNPEIGLCDGQCAVENLQKSYIGCDYYPTITLQHDSYNGGTKIFAAIIANTTGAAAQITVTRGAQQITQIEVPSGSVQHVLLPWVPELTKGVGPSKLTVDGAYRLRSNRPVTVYQYNLLYADDSNDASLLLPVNAWTGDYVVASFPHADSNNYPGFYAVVAREDDTVVKLTPSATGTKVQAGAGVAADGTGEVVLNADDVLQVVTASGGDLTGTTISANRKVQVIAGHKCSRVPGGVDACDHLEEAMFPIQALSQQYVVVSPVQSPNDNMDHAQLVRFIASADDTTLVFTPDQGVETYLAKAGDFIEIPETTAKFAVSADKKILVAQYMHGQAAGYGQQDPSMMLAVATDQYRKDYLFQAPTSWEANYVDVILKSGTTVQVDGQAVGGFIKIAGTDYSLARVALSNDGSGIHSLTASDGVGISVYGVQNFGSYWVVGGLELEHL